MYLSGRRSISGSFHDSQKDQARAEAIRKLFPELAVFKDRDNPLESLTIEVGYWRKANHIHKWFVDNCQDGRDDCGHYHVSCEQLKDLRDRVQRVIDWNRLATDLLPRQEGFFFGSNEIDDGYWEDLRLTLVIIDRALSLPDQWDFEYHSSW